jgi:hypothetical protein
VLMGWPGSNQARRLFINGIGPRSSVTYELASFFFLGGGVGGVDLCELAAGA